MLMACLAVTCCLCALAALAGATVPVIERVDMEATRAPQLSQPEMVARVQVRDADGAADLAGVTFLRPEFGETVVTPTSGPGTEWTVQGPDLVQVTLTDPWVVSGTYEIRAIDAEGNQDTATAPSAPAASDYPITCGIGVYESSSTVEVTPDITWSTGIPGGATTLRVYRAPRSLICDLVAL